MYWMRRLPFRIGTTSYIIPDDILPNVRWLAGQVQDVELVLFELDDGFHNLPTPEVIEELNGLATQHDLSYTVHLPLDLRLGEEGEPQHVSLRKAQKVIDCTLRLQPRAYILHLDGREARDGLMTVENWEKQAAVALAEVMEWAGDASRLCVENLDHYPPDFWDGVLSREGRVSRCVDIGHLWLEGHDPLPFLRRHLGRTRVIHLHGVAGRDHLSLHHCPPSALKAVLDELRRHRFTGVVTMEVFSEDDLLTSLAAIEAVA
jgi:sugar phosphate isomerase/epimerase